METFVYANKVQHFGAEAVNPALGMLLIERSDNGTNEGRAAAGIVIGRLQETFSSHQVKVVQKRSDGAGEIASITVTIYPPVQDTGSED